MKLALAVPDSHAPYFHRKATRLVQRIAKDLCPDVVLFLGDLADFYAINAHGRHPGMLHTLVDEVEQVNKFLDEWDKVPGKKILYEGNHCYRLERFIFNNCPALFGVTEIRRLLKIDERGWGFVDYGPNQLGSVLGSKLKIRHEPYGTNAKLSAQKAGCSLIYGHIHRIEQAYHVGASNHEQHVHFCPGWLGDQGFDKVFGYVKTHHQWQLGFALIYVDEKSRNFYHQIIPILPDMSCVVNGKRYK